jgi:hypothetical protein
MPGENYRSCNDHYEEPNAADIIMQGKHELLRIEVVDGHE